MKRNKHLIALLGFVFFFGLTTSIIFFDSIFGYTQSVYSNLQDNLVHRTMKEYIIVHCDYCGDRAYEKEEYEKHRILTRKIECSGEKRVVCQNCLNGAFIAVLDGVYGYPKYIHTRE